MSETLSNNIFNFEALESLDLSHNEFVERFRELWVQSSKRFVFYHFNDAESIPATMKY
jgi:hypothetical protein